MCRFFGNISIGKSRLDDSVFIDLVKLSQSGGPDSTCYYFDELVQFGFNRLAIIDLTSNANQPMISPSGRFVLMINGEIYNYRDLEKEFSLTRLRSGSDAEVVAHLLDILSFDELLAKLNGMFAICVLDKSTDKLFLARDFAGIKPLFYCSTSDGFVFGSQFNQVLLHPWLRNWSWSAVGLREYLQFGFMSAPYTVAENVYQLKPGEWLDYNIASNSLIVNNYSKFFVESPVIFETNSDTISQSIDFIKKAVERQLVADVPVGVFLSGGIDSSLVAAISSKLRVDIQSLTIGFDDLEHDESKKALDYAQYLGIKNECIRFSESELLSLFDQHNNIQTEPLADYSTLPTFLISKIASSRFKVMLSGDGGDELFWGYPRFRTFAKSSAYFGLPVKIVRKFIGRGLKSLNYDVTSHLGERTIGDANFSFHSYLNSHYLDEIWPGSAISKNISNDYACSSYDANQVLLYLRYNEFYHHLQRVLAKVDRMSMTNGLEVRVPLLDKELIEFSSTVIPELSNHLELKYILKKALEQYIPKEIIDKKKRGFSPPLRIWSRSVLREQILDSLRDIFSINVVGLDSNALLNYSESFINSEHEDLDGMWIIYSLINWKRNLYKSGF